MEALSLRKTLPILPHAFLSLIFLSFFSSFSLLTLEGENLITLYSHKLTTEKQCSAIKVAIKQRPQKHLLTGNKVNSSKANHTKTVKERKEEYNRARARIFSSENVISGTNRKANDGRKVHPNFSFGSVEPARVDDYDRSYDRYMQKFDPGFGFSGGPYTIQLIYSPVVTYNTEFPQLGVARRPQLSNEPQSAHMSQRLGGSWYVKSPPAKMGYCP